MKYLILLIMILVGCEKEATWTLYDIKQDRVVATDNVYATDKECILENELSNSVCIELFEKRSEIIFKSKNHKDVVLLMRDIQKRIQELELKLINSGN